MNFGFWVKSALVILGGRVGYRFSEFGSSFRFSISKNLLLKVLDLGRNVLLILTI